jgi:hypothetical protein
MQLDAGLLTSKLPVNRRVRCMASIVISLDFALERFFIWYSSVQTWPHHDAQLYFRHIHPTGVPGRVVKRKRAKYASGFLRRKSFIQRRPLVCIQMIHHHSHHFSLWVALVHQPLHLMREVSFRAPGSHIHVSPSCLRFAAHQEMARAMALGLIINSRDPPRLGWQGVANFCHQRLACCVEVHLRSLRIVWDFIPIKQVFHQRHTLGIDLRDTPLSLVPGLECVFCISLRTASRENDAVNPQATAWSASSLIVHWVWPSGALLQATAITWAACLPVSVGRASGLGCSSSAPKPASTTRLRVRSTVATPQSRAVAMWSSGSPSAAFSRMLARVPLRPACLPRRRSWSHGSRSSADKSMM